MNINSILDKIIRVLLVFVICISLTIVSIFVFPPSFAAVYEVPYFASKPDIDVIEASGLACFKDSSNKYIYVGSDVQDCRVAYIPSSNQLLFMTRTSPNHMFYSLFNNSVYSSSMVSGTDVKYTALNIGSTPSEIYIDSYDSIDSALADYDNVYAAPPNLYEGFRLPPGYLAAIQGSSVSFDLYTDMPEYSSIKQWAYSTQRYGLESSLPSQASFDYDYGTRIIWHITGDTNLLGEGYHAASSLSASVGSGYLLLVNPAYYGSTANIMNADMFNGVVTLSNVQGVDSIRLYSLGSYIGSGGITSDYSTNSAINNASVVVTNGGFYIENSDGTLTPVSDLPSFGDTSTDGSSSGLIAKFRAILEGVVEKIESLLIAPVEYINRLIVAASNFFAWLSGLWSWLPPAVSGVLTSVLYIMAIVGALKILWR